MSRPPYGSHSGCRHACQKRPTSQCGWTRRAAAQTVVAQRVPGRAGNALLRDRGNESLRRRLSEGAPSRGAHAGDGFIVGGSCSRAKTRLANALSVVKSGGKEVSHIEKNSDVRCIPTPPHTFWIYIQNGRHPITQKYTEGGDKHFSPKEINVPSESATHECTAQP